MPSEHKIDLIPLERIRELMRDRRIKGVCRAAGLSEPTLRSFMRNSRTPTLGTWEKLSAYFRHNNES